jgi:hypothetical protein
MSFNIMPKKCARITQRRRILTNKYSPLLPPYTHDATEANKTVEFNFEVLSPSMQIEERNSAYKFFNL